MILNLLPKSGQKQCSTMQTKEKNGGSKGRKQLPVTDLINDSDNQIFGKNASMLLSHNAHNFGSK